MTYADYLKSLSACGDAVEIIRAELDAAANAYAYDAVKEILKQCIARKRMEKVK